MHLHAWANLQHSHQHHHLLPPLQHTLLSFTHPHPSKHRPLQVLAAAEAALAEQLHTAWLSSSSGRWAELCLAGSSQDSSWALAVVGGDAGLGLGLGGLASMLPLCAAPVHGPAVQVPVPQAAEAPKESHLAQQHTALLKSCLCCRRPAGVQPRAAASVGAHVGAGAGAAGGPVQPQRCTQRAVGSGPALRWQRLGSGRQQLEQRGVGAAGGVGWGGCRQGGWTRGACGPGQNLLVRTSWSEPPMTL
jgi:hypothetical protein